MSVEHPTVDELERAGLNIVASLTAIANRVGGPSGYHSIYLDLDEDARTQMMFAALGMLMGDCYLHAQRLRTPIDVVLTGLGASVVQGTEMMRREQQ